VDGVALASVITSGVLDVTTPSIAVWTTRRNVGIARENRVQQRLADGYLKVLSLAEQEAWWLDASDWLAAHDTDDNDGSDGSDGSAALTGVTLSRHG
jgi:hypothetical protein